MQIQANKLKTPPQYEPVTLTLTFETQQELDRWTALFNDGPLIKFLSGDSHRLWAILNDLGGNARSKEAKELLTAMRGWVDRF